ncbi:MAG: hypothetical protein LBO69_00740 [Ignavibacteria bacterium]|jgi:Trk-type K+ transport system membrane component|nr:hypothetical protein [Ignavibacteria bacterium]
MSKFYNKYIKDYDSIVSSALQIIFGINSLLALIIVVLITGFYLNSAQTALLQHLMDITIIIFVAQEAIRFVLDLGKSKEHRESRLMERILAILLLAHLFSRETIVGAVESMFPQISIVDITFIYLGLTQLLIIASYILDFVRRTKFSNIKIHPGTITAFSFGTAIIIGSLLLMLPKSVPLHSHISYIDALFTSTSAVCVTGLSTINIADGFTLTGKIIILLLIQIGGIGVMTISSFLTAILLGGLSFRMNVMLREMLSEDNMSEISSVLRRISFFTFGTEAVGAICLYYALNGNFLTFNVDYFASAIFHSVSAFCNAGLSIYHGNLFSPIIHQNYAFYATLMGLVLIGGIGFLAFSNLFSYILHKKDKMNRTIRRLNLTTKLIFVVSGIIILGGGLLIFLSESYAADASFSTLERLFHSFFMVISSKTAGFDSVHLESMTNLTLLIIILVMWIGGSPGSTGGGIKNTTLGVLFLHFFAYLRNSKQIRYSYRNIHPASVEKAQMVLFATLGVTILSTMLLVMFEPKYSLMQLMFEAASAISTTGLTLGLTPLLSSASKLVLVMTMFIGRIGTLTFMFIFARSQDATNYEYPNEKVIVG